MRSSAPVRAVSIEYSIQIHTSAPVVPLAADDFLTCEVHAPHAAEGFEIDDGIIWSPQGAVVATMRQTRLAC